MRRGECRRYSDSMQERNHKTSRVLGLRFHTVLGKCDREVRLESGGEAKRLVEDVLSQKFTCGQMDT